MMILSCQLFNGGVSPACLTRPPSDGFADASDRDQVIVELVR